MNRHKILHVGGVLYWTIRTYNPDTMVLKDADSTPTVTVRKNGASTGDSVTIIKRSATTGLYDCSYNPAGEVEGDEFTIEEAATVTGTTTGAATYNTGFDVTVVALERGTNGALTDAASISSRIATDIMDGIDDWPAAVVVMQNGLATSSVLSAVKVGTDRFLTMIVLDGAVYQFTANALELGPSSSGSTSVTVTPTQAALTDNEAVDGTLIQVYYNTDSDISIGVVDAAGDSVTLTGKTLRFVVEDRFGNDVEVVEDADITKSSNTATLAVSTTTTGTAGQYKWALRDVNNGNGRLGHGILEVIAIPDKDV